MRQTQNIKNEIFYKLCELKNNSILAITTIFVNFLWTMCKIFILFLNDFRSKSGYSYKLILR